MKIRQLSINILLLFVLFLSNSCEETVSPQKSSNNFIKEYDGVEAKEVIVVNNSFMICGTTDKLGNGGENIYLMKISKTGDLIWDKTYGSDYRDRGTCMLKTSDGNLLIGGYTYGFAYHSQQMYLLKTNLDGDVQWANAFVHPSDSIGWGSSSIFSLLEIRNNRYIAIGSGKYVTGSMSSTTSSKALCVDRTGYPKWYKTYEQVYGWSYSSVNLNNNTSFLFSVNWRDYNDHNLYFTNIHSGEIENSISLNSPKTTYFSMISTSDDKIILCGETNSSPPEIRVDKIDKDGNYIWGYTFSKYYINVAYDIKETQDGGFIIVGYCREHGTDNSDILLIKIDSEGSLSWEKTFDLGMSETAFSVQQLDDNGYVFVGKSYPVLEKKENKIFVIRTNKNGVVENK